MFDGPSFSPLVTPGYIILTLMSTFCMENDANSACAQLNTYSIRLTTELFRKKVFSNFSLIRHVLINFTLHQTIAIVKI